MWGTHSACAGLSTPLCVNQEHDMIKDEFSTFKRHSAWFSQRACRRSRDPGPHLEDFWSRRAQASWDSKLPAWECCGPFNVAGRVTSLLVHPTDPRRLWAGAAAGGVWGSTDGGASWKSCWPRWASPNIGALAFDPADPECDLLRHRRSQHLAGLLPGQRPLHQPRWRRELGAAGHRRHPQPAAPHRRASCPGRPPCCTWAG